MTPIKKALEQCREWELDYSATSAHEQAFIYHISNSYRVLVSTIVSRGTNITITDNTDYISKYGFIDTTLKLKHAVMQSIDTTDKNIIRKTFSHKAKQPYKLKK